MPGRRGRRGRSAALAQHEDDRRRFSSWSELAPAAEAATCLAESLRLEARLLSSLHKEPLSLFALSDTWQACTAKLGKKMRSNLGYIIVLTRRSEVLCTSLPAEEIRAA